jgi:hypothetical protein
MHEQDAKIARDKERRLIEERKRMQREEMERLRKHEEHKAKLAKAFADEQKELRERLATIHEADKKVQIKMTFSSTLKC